MASYLVNNKYQKVIKFSLSLFISLSISSISFSFKRQYYQIHRQTSDYPNDKEEEDEEENLDLFTNIEVTNKLKKINEHYSLSNYPIDLITFNNELIATSNLNNEIKIWNLSSTNYLNCLQNTININNNYDIENQNETKSIWSICFINSYNNLAVGLSNGQLLIYNLHLNYIINSSDNNGITHIITNSSSSFIVTRLNGYLELYDFELKLINRIQAHLNEITFITNHLEYILTSNSQEQIIKIFNNNNLEYINSLREIYPPTALTISKYNSKIASSGYKNGSICLWNLANGDCKYKLNDTNSIIKLELTENYVISLNRVKTLSIWNLVNGQILNEFQMSLFTKHTKSINHFLCTNKYLITTSKNNDKQKFIFIWTLSESKVLIKKKLSINSKLVDQIKYFNILNNDSLLIHDTNHSIYLLEI